MMPCACTRVGLRRLGNARDAYIVEVTGNKFGTPFPLTLDINKPENCQVAQASGANASITEHSVYNRNGAAFVMIEYGGAGLRIFDLRDGRVLAERISAQLPPAECAQYGVTVSHP